MPVPDASYPRVLPPLHPRTQESIAAHKQRLSAQPLISSEMPPPERESLKLPSLQIAIPNSHLDFDRIERQSDSSSPPTSIESLDRTPLSNSSIEDNLEQRIAQAVKAGHRDPHLLAAMLQSNAHPLLVHQMITVAALKLASEAR